MSDIYVTKSFLPPIEEYQQYLQKIWDNGQLTNQGPLLKELEFKLGEKLGTQYLHFVTNGTIALQISLRALDITEGEIITTPFSYVATTSSILWEKCKPVFVDIESETFCIDPDKIEAAITKDTKAILAVHVFGFPCDVEAIETIAKRHSLKVVYDAAHAFGVEYKNQSLINYGDASTCSFHATKLFHTIEGGCVVLNDKKDSDKLELIKRFGHDGDVHKILGVNAKASEFQAAMGLLNLKYVDELIEKRAKISKLYDQHLSSVVTIPTIDNEKSIKRNYAYYPVLFRDEAHLEKCFRDLNRHGIFPRRYFYPSLNKLPYVSNTSACPTSEDISSRIACLPLYDSLSEVEVRKICEVITNVSFA